MGVPKILHFLGHPTNFAATFLALVPSAIACGSHVEGQIVTPEGTVQAIAWSTEELESEVSVKTLRVTPQASYHAVRLLTGESPHVHDRHDLVVFVLRGRAIVHLAERQVRVGPGDVIEIPRGVTHWAENEGPGAGEVYAVFSPPFDGQDYRIAGAEAVTP